MTADWVLVQLGRPSVQFGKLSALPGGVVPLPSPTVEAPVVGISHRSLVDTSNTYAD